MESDRGPGSERDFVLEHWPCALDQVLLSSPGPQRRGGLRILQQSERHHVRGDSDGDPHSHADPDADAHADSYADADSHGSWTDGNSDAHADADSDGSRTDGNPHSYADADSDGSRTDGDPHSNADADFLQRRRALGEVVSGWWDVR